jgi:predicted metal-dependent HD superfamily phosphohydrolase
MTSLAQSTHPTGSASLRERFMGLWRRCLLPGADDDAPDVWADIEARYAEPHRRYHDARHLEHCLKQFDLIADRIRRPDDVEAAIWFHDVIVVPGRRDNEERSAAYFGDVAAGKVAPGTIDAVRALILRTTHRDAPADPDHQFLCDIDLSSFGSPWEAFLENSAAVRAEFTGSDEEYYHCERAFLESLLRRARIFHSEFYHALYEGKARDNIRRFIGVLEQSRSGAPVTNP